MKMFLAGFLLFAASQVQAGKVSIIAPSQVPAPHIEAPARAVSIQRFGSASSSHVEAPARQVNIQRFGSAPTTHIEPPARTVNIPRFGTASASHTEAPLRSVKIQRMPPTTKPKLYSGDDPYHAVVPQSLAASRPKLPAALPAHVSYADRNNQNSITEQKDEKSVDAKETAVQ
ncbi:hypothetical protein [Ralstonia phage RP31]|uniref:Uncharacterized protein n=2 Tax=Ripduovirus RP12 TaxID=2560700 RepID=A0A1L7N0Y5_9CAUD|nr:hypothetical protein FDH28_gp257 [Ralstonia phage RP12]BAW19138.1 hypothetical protein [Ralstonia phage RP12]BAW19424.1 hypothetical protein [Ralstonia phage RP31]